MSVTASQRALLPWATLLDSVQTFALLPDWLVGAIQSEQVRSALTRSIPEFASGTLTLQDCRAKHVRLSDDGTGWTGSYYCTIADPAAGQRRIVLLLGRLIPPHQAAPDQSRTPVPFGSAGWRWYVPELHVAFEMQPSDTQLTALSQLTDSEQARALLEQSIPRHAPASHELHIESCRSEVLRYHPGLRCTIGYHLTYPSNLATRHHWPTFVVAKTYEGKKGQNAYDSMQALWDSPLGTSGAVTIAEPLAYIPELKLLVQGPIHEEQTLQTLIGAALRAQTAEALADLDDYMRKTAVGLAELHSTGVSIGDTHRWEDELTEVRTFAQRLTVAIPDLAGAAAQLCTCLESLASASPPDPQVPTHGTFRPAQVLLDRGRIGFIDFDSFCQAEPAMDLALFMVATIDIGMSVLCIEEHQATDPALDSYHMGLLTQLETIANRFLAHYAALRPVARQRVVVWAALNMMELIVRCWERVKPVRLNHIMLMLEHHLRVHLAE